MGLREPQLKKTQEHPVALAGIDTVLKSFNRNTTWVATGLLGSVIFAALMLALQEREPKTDNLTGEARQTTSDLLLNSNPTAISDVVDSNEKSTGETSSGPAASVDRELAPERSQPGVQANATSRPSALRSDPARMIQTKSPNLRLRSSVHFGYVDVKTRLLALWHQSLRREKSRGWNLLLNSNKRQRKSISYTATTGH